MATPPNPTGGPSYTPISTSAPRRRPLPTRSSLSNSFSYIPSTPPQPITGPSTLTYQNSSRFNDTSFSPSLSRDGEVSFSAISAPVRSRMNAEGHMSMAQISPRARPSPAGDSYLPKDLRRSRLAESDTPDALKRAAVRIGADDEEESEKGWGMVDSMRLWRQDALIQHSYKTAAFWGDKILSLTGDVNDAFWLAQTHFLTGHYLRAERLLTESLPSHDRSGGGHGKGKGKSRMEDQPLLDGAAKGRLVDESLFCRYLAAQCMVQQEKHHEALALLGESNPFRPTNAQAKISPDDGIKLHSSICHLRGLLHLRLSSLAMAKESFIEAVVLDVKNYEAFHELIEGGMMSSKEEWDFVQTLSYSSHLTEEQAHFVKLMYTTKLKKDTHGREIALARDELIRKYNLGDNCDVMVGLADELYLAYKWEDCYAITSRILAQIPAHPTALPLHLACMQHIHRLRSSLFKLAHDLVEQDPHSATTWYAVGLWYFSGKKWSEARPKANLIDSRFAPAWIAFAHSFAYEGEHDQAITAYSTSARLFAGTHLPLLFIGMEYLQLNNTILAEEYFHAAQAINDSDPLLLNELGVVAYNKDDHYAAARYFRKAITAAQHMQGVASIWAATHTNLGHAYRLLGNLDDAHNSYAQSIALDPSNVTSYSSLAVIAHLRGDVRGAIRGYHSALSLAPQDPITTVLLEMALKEQVERLAPNTISGLPAAIADPHMDPFAVPKGNPAFGPLPREEIESEQSVSEGGSMRAELGGVRSVRSRGQVGRGERMARGPSMGSADEENEVGEGSTMEIEDD